MLTVRDVAEKLDANPGTIRMWCINKTFPHAVQEETLRGPVWLIPESDLKGFERRGRGRPPKTQASGAAKAPAETTRKLNQAFRAATETDEASQKKATKKGVKK